MEPVQIETSDAARELDTKVRDELAALMGGDFISREEFVTYLVIEQGIGEEACSEVIEALIEHGFIEDTALGYGLQPEAPLPAAELGEVLATAPVTPVEPSAAGVAAGPPTPSAIPPSMPRSLPRPAEAPKDNIGGIFARFTRAVCRQRAVTFTVRRCQARFRSCHTTRWP
jgi:hypothetical protein